MTGLISNIGQSLGYSVKNTIFRPFFWIGMLLTTLIMLICFGGSAACLAIVYGQSSGSTLLIPGIVLLIIGILIAFFFNGIQVQIFANKNLTFKGFFSTIGRGIQLAVINFIYSIIIMIVFGICVALGIFGGQGAFIGETIELIAAGSPVLFPNGVTPLGIIMLVILILLAIFFGILSLAADVNFARAGKFGAAFHFGEICKRIGVFGVLKFIIAIVLFIIVMVIISIIIGLILGLIAMIPNAVAVSVVTVIFTMLLIPFMIIFPTKYFSNLFAD